MYLDDSPYFSQASNCYKLKWFLPAVYPTKNGADLSSFSNSEAENI
jgi:hypothetical protein